MTERPPYISESTWADMVARENGDGTAPDEEIEFAPKLELVPSPERPPEFEVVTARDLCAKPDREASAELLGPLVVRSARTVIAGATGHGKTALALQWLRAIVHREEFCDWRGPGEGRGLVLDLEQGERSVKRALRDAKLGDSDRVDLLLIPDGLALDQDDEQLHALTSVIEVGGYTVVVLDPFYKAHRADDPNAERPVIDLMRRLDALRTRFGFGLVLPAHPRKDHSGATGPRKLTIDDVAGSGAIVRGAEVVIAIERVSNGYARLRFLKDREGVLHIGDAWNLTFGKAEGFRRAADDGAGEVKAPPQRIADWIRSRGGSATPKEIRDEFDIVDDTLRRRRDALDELGIAYQEKPALYVARADNADPATRDPRPSRGEAIAGLEGLEQAENTPRPATPRFEPARGAECADLQGESEPRDPALLKESTPSVRGAPEEELDWR